MTQGDGFRLTQIGQISLRATNLDRAVPFYRDVLGLELLFQFPPLAFFRCGGVRLMLGPSEKGEFDHPGSILYYKVDDIHEAHRVLGERGARFRDEPHLVHRAADHELWMTFLDDPEGNTLAIMCEKR
ncbi:MAG: VOC family protein [Gemmatimonadota bacterium]|nr:VOC family protein [Gemmatimonadota bacterium]